MKKRQLLYIIPFILLILSGCTTYPQHGNGGMAEDHIGSDFSPVMPDTPLGPEHGMRFDWQLAKLHLDMLVQEGAKWCFPASVLQLSIRQNRIAREISGGLQIDAANDIIIQRKALNKLDQQLTYVTNKTECVPPEGNNSTVESQIDVVETLVEQLNADNQFAHNSSEINPKYMGHLAEAAHILKEYPNLSLTITGHADADGDSDYNDKLALERAQQVTRYLSIFGLSPKRITTQSLGEKIPLFEGDTAGVMLTNRRVSVEVHSEK